MVSLFSVAHCTLPIKGKVTPSLKDHSVGDGVILDISSFSSLNRANVADGVRKLFPGKKMGDPILNGELVLLPATFPFRNFLPVGVLLALLPPPTPTPTAGSIPSPCSPAFFVLASSPFKDHDRYSVLRLFSLLSFDSSLWFRGDPLTFQGLGFLSFDEAVLTVVVLDPSPSSSSPGIIPDNSGNSCSSLLLRPKKSLNDHDLELISA